MLSDIQDPGLIRALRQAYKLQEPQAFVLDRVVSPVSIVGDLTTGPEEVPYGRSSLRAGSAQGAAWMIRNPPGSNILVRLVQALISVAIGSTWWVYLAETDLSSTTVLGGGHRLDRFSPELVGTAIVETGGFSATPNEIVQFRFDGSPPAMPRHIYRPLSRLVVPPGGRLVIATSASTGTHRVSLEWTEFPDARSVGAQVALGRLAGLMPWVLEGARQAIALAETCGYRPHVTSGWRSCEEQAELRRRWESGESRWPANRPGDSSHNWGLSFDSVVPPEHLAGWTAIRQQIGFHVPANDPIHAEVPNWRACVADLGNPCTR